MKKLAIYSLYLASLFTFSTFSENLKHSLQPTQSKPNIVIFYVDDLGYGDLSSYGAIGVKTPNVDELAKNGIRFTDAHTTAATCTPSRYSLLTGEYAFRKKAAVLKGDAPLLIDPKQATLPRMLKNAGYQTAVVGKWHLGLGNGDVDWNKSVKPGPLEIGFDYSFLLPATGDRVPSVYLENHHVMNLEKNDPLFIAYDKKIGDRPTGYENPELLRQQADNQHNKTIINGISRIGWMQGGKSAEWKDEDFHQIFVDKANNFINKNHKQPFFLFFPFHDIHVPRLPHEKFQGKSTMGPRGDAIVQMDWMTGAIINQLKTQGVYENTLIIFTSDNGAVLQDGYEDNALALVGKHKPNGPFRGGKYSAYEAGTRVPLIVHYPEKISPGVSDSLISQVDIYASLAALTEQTLNKTEAIDSENHLNAFTNSQQAAREYLLEESYTLAIRHNQWKYIEPTQNKNTWIAENKFIEGGYKNIPQLFNLAEDQGETKNLASKYPDKVTTLQNKIDLIRTKNKRR